MEEDIALKSLNILENQSMEPSKLENFDDVSKNMMNNNLSEQQDNNHKIDTNTNDDPDNNEDVSNNENKLDSEGKNDDNEDEDDDDIDENDLVVEELMREKMKALLNQSLLPKTPERKISRPLKIKREKPQQEYYGLDIKKLRQWIREQETENLKKIILQLRKYIKLQVIEIYHQ